MAGVRFERVAKRYGEVSIIEDLDLDIHDHEFMVLVGPSGCGKSTALRMIAGLEEISAGRVMIGERVVNDLQPKDRDVAMVFQSYALYPHMTVRENIEFGLKIRKTAKDEMKRRVDGAATTLGIGALLDRRPKQLSGGQRQRVAVARAIVRNPSVFLFDEPLSNLDAKLRVQMRAEITKLQQRLETTCVYVTHDQVEAMTMGHRVAIMKEGKIQQVGTPLDVYDRPANIFVAQFIGTPPMNFESMAARSPARPSRCRFLQESAESCAKGRPYLPASAPRRSACAKNPRAARRHASRASSIWSSRSVIRRSCTCAWGRRRSSQASTRTRCRASAHRSRSSSRSKRCTSSTRPLKRDSSGL